MEHCSFTGQAIWLKRPRIEALRSRLQELQIRLQAQIQSLPLGNEGWIATERELNAAEAALSQMGDWGLG
ncbi:MAG: hypothetical protein NTW83_09450 [Cyanobacteria bacterium]|nr:hypothetical protein [Cyanobacteriota bacterium]